MAYRPPSSLYEQKRLPVYVFTYFAQYMNVACLHKKRGGGVGGGGEDSLWSENQ